MTNWKTAARLVGLASWTLGTTVGLLSPSAPVLAAGNWVGSPADKVSTQGASTPAKPVDQATVSATPDRAAKQSPFTLQDCVRYALTHNTELKRQGLTYDNQVLSTLIQRAEFDLSFSADTDRYIQDDRSRGSLSVSKKFLGDVDVSASTTANRYDDGGATSDSANFNVAVSKVILGGGSVLESRNGIDDSVVDEAIKLNEFEQQKRQLVFEVTREFYRIIRNLQTKRIQVLRLERSKRNLEHAIERDEPLDISTAKLQVPEDEIAVLRAQRNIEASLDSLKAQMGMPIPDDLVIDESFSFQVHSFDEGKDIKFSLDNHESVLNSRLNLRKAQWDQRIDKTKVLPTVTVDGSYQKNSNSGLNFGGDHDSRIGLNLSWAWRDRADRARHRQALNTVKSRKHHVYESEQNRIQTIRRLARTLRESTKAVALQEARVALAEERLELFQTLWENGEINILEFYRSQNEVENAKVALVNQKTNYMEQLAEYQFNVGYDSELRKAEAPAEGAKNAGDPAEAGVKKAVE